MPDYEKYIVFRTPRSRVNSYLLFRQKAWTNLASTWSNLNLSWIIKTEIKQSSTIKIYQNLSIKA